MRPNHFPSNTLHHDLYSWMQQHNEHLETLLENWLSPADAAAPKLYEAMRYAVLGRGKRVRPLLVFAAGELVAASPRSLEHVAVAVELIHAYSLAHDDLPCMDNDTLRRGKPTVHVAFGEANALLAGDALQALAFEVLTQTPEINTATQVKLLRVLAQASGAAGMAGGQAIDLESVRQTLSQPALEQMHALKTGALLAASVQLGAYCGRTLSSEEMSALGEFSRHIGLAFQVWDDVLDVTTDTHTLGKTAGKDVAQDKPTYVALLGVSAAQDYAKHLHQQALQALAGFGVNADRLCHLTDYLVHRTH